MKKEEENLLNENIPDERIKAVYKSVFKKAGMSLKDFTIERDKKEGVTYFHFTLPIGIHFWIRWPMGVDAAYFVSVVNGKESEQKTIYSPNALTIANSLAVEYKKLVKKQGFLKQIISLIFEENKRVNQNPLIKS